MNQSFNMDPLPPIPTPTAHRWREFRIQALPVITFIAVLAGIVFLWNGYVVPTNLVGEVETTQALIITTLPGTIKEIKVRRFQRVSAGEEIALVNTFSPETQQASLRVIEADLKLLRTRMQLDLERNHLSYESLRLEYLKERAELALEYVNARIYEAEVARLEQLLTNSPPLTSQTLFDASLRLAATTRTNVIEKEKYLAEKEKILPTLAPATLVDESILESIKAQEDLMRVTEQITSLKSPIDGVVSVLDHFPGQKIMPNIPLAVISGVKSDRIVGYVRKPYETIPKPGDTVQIRSQNSRRQVAMGTVTEVSAQLELINTRLIPAATGTLGELGLPFAVSIPAELILIPGEAVDLFFNKK